VSGRLSDRTRLIFSEVLGLDPNSISREFRSQSLLLKLDPLWADTYAGQVLALAALNVLLRWDLFLPRAEIFIPQAPLQLKNPLLQREGENLRSALEGLTCDLGQAECVRFLEKPPRRADADHVVNLGGGDVSLRGRRQTLYLGCDGWIAYISRQGLEVPPPAPRQRNNPIGACVAAVLGAAQLFNGLLEPYLRDRPDFALPKMSIAFNAFTYGAEKEPNPKLPSSVDLSEIVLLGAGGLGAAFLFTLSLVGGLKGSLTIVDPDRLEEHSLNRALTATLRDVEGQSPNKAVLATEYVRSTSRLKVDAHPCSYQGMRRSWEESRDFAFGQSPLAVLTVDNAQARLALQEDFSQGRFSEVLIGGYARFDCLVARAFRSGPCIRCLERAGLLGTAPRRTPSISHVTALAGTLLAAELLKRRIAGDHYPLNRGKNLFVTSLTLPPSPGGLLRLGPLLDCPCQGHADGSSEAG